MVIYLAVGFLCWFCVIWFVQRLILFPSWAIPDSMQMPPGQHMQVLWHEDGHARVEAWLIAGEGASEEHPGPAVIFTHGNAELIDFWQHDLQRYVQMGVTVLLVEYRGYGRSTGRPSQRAIVKDLIAFYDRLAAMPSVDASRMVLHGRSLGGGFAAALAQQRKPAAVILESTFTGVAPLARRFTVPRLLVRDPLDSLATLEGFDKPVLIYHGERDEIIPVAHARKLAALNNNWQLVVEPEMSHNSGPLSQDEYWATIEKFLIDAKVLTDK